MNEGCKGGICTEECEIKLPIHDKQQIKRSVYRFHETRWLTYLFHGYTWNKNGQTHCLKIRLFHPRHNPKYLGKVVIYILPSSKSIYILIYDYCSFIGFIHVTRTYPPTVTICGGFPPWRLPSGNFVRSILSTILKKTINLTMAMSLSKQEETKKPH